MRANGKRMLHFLLAGCWGKRLIAPKHDEIGLRERTLTLPR